MKSYAIVKDHHSKEVFFAHVCMNSSDNIYTCMCPNLKKYFTSARRINMRKNPNKIQHLCPKTLLLNLLEVFLRCESLDVYAIKMNNKIYDWLDLKNFLEENQYELKDYIKEELKMSMMNIFCPNHESFIEYMKSAKNLPFIQQLTTNKQM